MTDPASKGLFGRIAPLYSLFFQHQRKSHGGVLDLAQQEIDMRGFKSVLDVGCGTGALCAAWHERGYKVTGVDQERRMVEVARRKNAGSGIEFLTGDVIHGLPFPDRSFDVVIASYVAHGLPSAQRHVMYGEMKRLARNLVIIHDFNRVRSGLLDFIEAMEGSDYLRFIEVVHDEMLTHFSSVELLEVGARATWYIGRV
jgi:ubiquinone/menaquinone biosynthesis C-methylase UbiE